MTEGSNNPNNGSRQGGSGSGGGGGSRRRRRPGRSGGGNGPRPQGQGGNNSAENRSEGGVSRNRDQQRSGNSQGQGQGGGQQRPQGQPSGGQRSSGRNSRNRRGSGRVLTTNQVLVKYDNLLEQHLITRRKYFEYFNRVDDRQLYKLEKNFFDSIEHLRRFEERLEPWQREALEKRKTERYRLDLTYSNNRNWNPEEIAKADFAPDENEDPHFKDSQKEAFTEYAEDTEESEGTFEDYLKLKGLT